MSSDEEKNDALSLGLLVFSYPAYGDVGLQIFFLYQPFGGISYLIFYAFLGFQVIVLQFPLLCRSLGVMHNRPILHLCLVFEHIELRRLWPCRDLVDETDEVPNPLPDPWLLSICWEFICYLATPFLEKVQSGC